jgi:fucose permease
LWVGQAVSELGSRGYGVAIMLWVLAGTGSPAAVGAVSTVTLAAFAASSVPAGWVVDRFDRRRTMMAADGVSAVSTGTLAVVAWAGSFHLAHVVAVGAILGVGWSVRGLAEDAAVPHVVEEKDVPTAIAMVEGRGYATGVAGPPLAAALYGVSAALPFLTHAIAFLTAGATASRVRTPLQDEQHNRAPETSLSAGLREWWRTPFLRVTALLSAVNGCVTNGCGLITLVLLTQAGTSPAVIGFALAAAYGAGMVGSFAEPLLRRRISAPTLLVVSAAAGTASVLALAASSLAVAVAAYAVLLLTQPLWQIAISARTIEIVPDELRGRVGGAVGLVTFVPMMLAPLVTGVLLATTSSTFTALVFAAAMAVVTVTAAVSGTIRTGWKR